MTDLQIPSWFVQDPLPCPCGREAFGHMVLIQAQNGDTLLCHMHCVTEIKSQSE